MGSMPPPYNPQNDPRNDPRWQKQQARAQRDHWRWYHRGQRRSSIVGPLLLVAIGVVFFLVQSGRVAADRFWNWYGRWWPLMLVLLGVFLLAEWAFDRARQKDAAVPARSMIGGGVISLVIVLAILGVGANGMGDGRGMMGKNFSINGDNWDDLVGSKHESDPPPVVHPFSAGQSLVIDNPRGDVTVSGTSDDGQLHITTHNEVRTSSDSEADTRLKQLAVMVTDVGTTTSVHIPSVDHGRADITVLMPAASKVTVTANRGDVHVNSIKSQLMLTANHGDVDIAAISGGLVAHVNNRSSTLNVHSVTGPVQVEGSGDEANFSDIDGALTVKGDFFGGGHLQHIRGAVNYNTGRLTFALARLDGELNIESRDSMSADQVVGPFTIDTKSRNITLTRVNGDVKVVNSHGDVEIGAVSPVGSINVENRDGAITVRLPQSAKFTLQADASGGNVNADFSLGNQARPNDGSLTGTGNGGGNAIRLTTTHADISLEKNDAMPLPPLPPAPKLSAVPPMPPNMPEEAKQAVRDARQAATDASNEARKAAAEGRETARQAQRQANDEAKRAIEAAKQNQ